MTDPIVEEVRAARAAIAAEFGHDRGRFLAWARDKEEKERLAKAPKKKNKATEVRTKSQKPRFLKTALSTH